MPHLMSPSPSGHGVYGAVGCCVMLCDAVWCCGVVWCCVMLEVQWRNCCAILSLCYVMLYVLLIVMYQTGPVGAFMSPHPAFIRQQSDPAGAAGEHLMSPKSVQGHTSAWPTIYYSTLLRGTQTALQFDSTSAALQYTPITL